MPTDSSNPNETIQNVFPLPGNNNQRLFSYLTYSIINVFTKPLLTIILFPMSDPRSTFLEVYPEAILLDSLGPRALCQYLNQSGWLSSPLNSVQISEAGAGNMNITKRVSYDGGSLILKQSIPWVARYPEIPAPQDRLIREARFYQMVYASPQVSDAMPELMGLDVKNRIAAFTDLGPSSDFTHLYARDNPLQMAHMLDFAHWLSALHGLKFSETEQNHLRNRDMRKLNFEHIFCFPFQPDNGLDLDAITPGLRAEAQKIIEQKRLVNWIRDLGEAYYQTDGPVLIHGDFFPGSLLRTPQGLKVIDPEFGFFGFAEFDAGVIAAHLLMSHHTAAHLDLWFDTYQPPEDFRKPIAYQIAGIEILRRLLGVAQLPLQANLAEKQSWIRQALDWIGPGSA